MSRACDPQCFHGSKRTDCSLESVHDSDDFTSVTRPSTTFLTRDTPV
jgi:hypothetical protein